MKRRSNRMKKMLIRNQEILIYVCLMLIDMLNIRLRNIKIAVFLDIILLLSLFLLEVKCVLEQKRGEFSFIRIPFSIFYFYNNGIVWNEFGVQLFSLKSIYIMALIVFVLRNGEMVIFQKQRKKNHDKNLMLSLACDMVSFSNVLFWS